MDRRKRINVNRYESLTDAELRRVADEYGARVCPKVRVADALDINNSGLSSDEFAYALKAHFDFVVVDDQERVAFAVEFDGPHHDVDPDARRRDRLKSAVCKQLNMPLLRFNDQHLEPVGFPSPYPGKRSFLAGDFSSVVGWVAECWFLEQARGEVPFDEPFIAQSFFGYDPTIHARAYLQEMRRSGVVVKPWPEVHRYKQEDAWAALAVVQLGEHKAVAGYARCQSLNFTAMSAWELCEELAVLGSARKLQKYLAGQLTPYTLQEIEEWKERLNTEPEA
jgi:hypothetical protein